MIYIVANSKGGVGKSLASVIFACLLHIRGQNFKLIELDDNNQSIQFKNSDFLNSENSISHKLDQKQEVATDILFDLMSDPNLDYVIDIGGGNDTYAVLEILKSIELAKTYLIPTTRIKKYLKNANDVFEYVNDPHNTYFVLNQYSNLDNIKEEFIYFFGDKKLGIKPVSKNFETDQFISIPFSNFFQISEDLDQTILDLANVSRDLTQTQATQLFFQKADGDRDVFHSLMQKYWNSEGASKALGEIEQNFEKFLNMTQTDPN